MMRRRYMRRNFTDSENFSNFERNSDFAHLGSEERRQTIPNIMRRLIFTICGTCALAATSSALTVTLTPGSMKSEIAALENTLDSRLVLKGSANVTDLSLLKDMSSKITSLDMSQLKIEAYSYAEGDYMNRKEFAADEIPPYMLMGSAVRELTLPSETKIIGESALSACDLDKFTLPSSVEKVGDYAFANCPNLKQVKISGEATLGKGLFKDCRNLQRVDFDYSITAIPYGTFDGCESYSGSIPATVLEVGAYAYRGTSLAHLNLQGVCKIGDFAFADMENLLSVVISTDEPTQMGTGIFFNDSGLENIPVVVFNAPKLTLAHTSGKNNSVIKSPEIGEAAFANNSDIDTLTLGSTVRKIDAHAFRNLSALVLVDVELLGSNVPEVDEKSFSGLENAEGRYDINLNVADGSDEAWRSHPVWSLFNIGHYDTGVEDIEIGYGDMAIEINRIGNRVEIESTNDIDDLSIFDIKGIVLYQGHGIAGKTIVTDIPDSGVIIVSVRIGNVVKTVKLL